MAKKKRDPKTAALAQAILEQYKPKKIKDIYGFEVSHDRVATITDTVIPEMEWRNHPLQKCYAFLFVDCMYVTLRNGY